MFLSLFVHEVFHLIIGILLGLALFKITHKKKVFLWVILASLLIDLDHLVDYFLAFGFTFNPFVIPAGEYFDLNKKALVLFHSWEVALILLILGLIKSTRFQIIFLSVGAGMLGHLLVDQITNTPPWDFFFILVRISHGFLQPYYW